MKKLQFKEILICSHTERKAKRVLFDPKRTVIYGQNDMGKSSLIKTIFMTFGAHPKTVNSRWKRVNAVSMVRFSVNGVEYSILKNDKLYAVFNQNDQLIQVFNSVTNQLGPFMAELMEFKIALPDRFSKIIVPPPAFMFLPFYVDQDSGWSANWDSFSNLAQIPKFRDPIVYYHTGIRGNEYYDVKNMAQQYGNELIELQSEKRITKNLLTSLKDKISTIDFNIDIENFKEEVTELLIECEKLKVIQDAHKDKIVSLYNQKMVAEAQLAITQGTLIEAKKDFNFASDKLHDVVECPTCGAGYDNSFAERFEIAMDSDRCAELLVEVNAALIQISLDIEKENEGLNYTIIEITKIEHILQKKRGDLELRDVIENAGHNEVKAIFDQSLKDINEKIYINGQKQLEVETKTKSLENKNKKKEIENFYFNNMSNNLQILEVESLNPLDYKRINTKINDTGSSLPRALISFYFAMFDTIKKYSTAIYCPLVIDSPNQQAQDKEHIEKIYGFILDRQPEDSQLILGLEDLYGIDFNCPIVELKEKFNLLQKDEYTEVAGILSNYFQQINTATGTLF